jgi:uncharacterized protein affecting Mg2+/Co2+ transport
MTLGKGLAEMGWKAIDCVYLSEKRDKRKNNHVTNYMISIKSGRFLKYLRRYYLLTKGLCPVEMVC